MILYSPAFSLSSSLPRFGRNANPGEKGRAQPLSRARSCIGSASRCVEQDVLPSIRVRPYLPFVEHEARRLEEFTERGALCCQELSGGKPTEASRLAEAAIRSNRSEVWRKLSATLARRPRTEEAPVMCS